MPRRLATARRLAPRGFRHRSLPTTLLVHNGDDLTCIPVCNKILHVIKNYVKKCRRCCIVPVNMRLTWLAIVSVADQIRSGRLAKGFSQEQLAELLGVSRTAIINWENPEKAPQNLKPHIIIELARILGKPRSAFTRFGGDAAATTGDMCRHAIVLLSWEDLKHVAVGGNVRKDVIRKPDFIEVSEDISQKALAFSIKDDSMEPEFHASDEIIIDPDLKPGSSDDFVLVRLKNGEHLFRRYRPRASRANFKVWVTLPITSQSYDLVAENPEWSTVSVTSQSPASILGTMVEHRRKRRTVT